MLKKFIINLAYCLVFFLAFLGCSNNSNSEKEPKIEKTNQEENINKNVGIPFLISLFELENNTARDKKILDFEFELGRLNQQDNLSSISGFQKSEILSTDKNFEFIRFTDRWENYIMQYLTNNKETISNLLYQIESFGVKKSEDRFLVNDIFIHTGKAEVYGPPLFSFVFSKN